MRKTNAIDIINGENKGACLMSLDDPRASFSENGRLKKGIFEFMINYEEDSMEDNINAFKKAYGLP